MKCDIYIAAVKILRAEPFDLSKELSEIPKKFGPHITLKGRFSVEHNGSLFDVHELLVEACSLLSNIDLSSWINITPDLVWRECLPGHDGYKNLKEIHRCIKRRLEKHSFTDMTPAQFQDGGFRPHVTIRWGKSDIFEGTEKFSNISCVAGKFSPVIYKYKESPFSSNVCEVEIGQ